MIKVNTPKYCVQYINKIIGFVHAYQIKASLAKNGISSQNNFYIFKLLMFHMQC